MLRQRESSSSDGQHPRREPIWEPFALDLCGRLWDVCGIESLPFRAVWTAVDARGHGLEIYG